MFSFPSGAEILLFLGLVLGLFLTALGTVLKLTGVLLLSWWWIASAIPLLLLIAITIAGIGAIIGR